MSERRRSKEKWVKHYSSGHNILLVGEGDFSFALCLGMNFRSAANIIATSLDSYDELINKYKNAKENLEILKALGASLLHGVDATHMMMLPDLQWKKFHRIIYNFPHAGFYGKEDSCRMISMHMNLVHGFLWNARSMLLLDGEIHISHKITAPFDSWKIEDLASDCSLFCIGQDEFKIEDYPGYNNKRGSGSRPDEPFPLGACRTFKFKPNYSSSSPTSKTPIKPGDWYTKPETLFLINIEPEYAEKTFEQLFSLYFFSDNHFITTNPTKSREWYEAILIATNSIDIFHVYQPDREKPGVRRLAYSKCKLLQIHTPSTWNASNLNTPIQFQKQMRPSAYTYFDYVKAFQNFLLIRPCTHCWVFRFASTCPKSVPMWFFRWFDQFGPTADILPIEYKNKFDSFEKLPLQQISKIEKYFSFFFDNKLPWILTWEYCKENDEFGYTTLARQIKIKWWNAFDPETNKSEKRKEEDASSTSSAKEKLKNMFLNEEMKAALKILYQELLERENKSPATPEDDYDPFGGPLEQSPPHFSRRKTIRSKNFEKHFWIST